MGAQMDPSGYSALLRDSDTINAFLVVFYILFSDIILYKTNLVAWLKVMYKSLC